MNYILAAIPRKQQHYKVWSGDIPIFEDTKFNIDHYVEYNTDHRLDEECWFKIEAFSTKDFCLSFIKEEFDSKKSALLDKKLFDKIKYICAIQDNQSIFCFQKITSSLFLNKKFLSFGDRAELKVLENSFAIKEEPDAIYFKDKDILIFKNLPTISSIFKGIDELYKEATDEDTKNFLQQSFITTENFDYQNVSKPNRKRIAMAINTLGTFDDDMKRELIRYINDYCDELLEFDEQNASFKISTDAQLKSLLYGIEQRFYTTRIGSKKRLANSIVEI